MGMDRDWFTRERVETDIVHLVDMLAEAGEPQTEKDRRHVRAIRRLLNERRRMLSALLDAQCVSGSKAAMRTRRACRTSPRR